MKQSFGMAPDVNVQTEHSTTPRAPVSHPEAWVPLAVQGGERKALFLPSNAPGRPNSLLQTFPVLPSPNLILREKLKSDVRGLG